jgi:hypothetical protein
MSSQVPFLPCLPSSSKVWQLSVWRTTSSLVPYLRVLHSPTLVLIPSRLVTLASVAIPSLLAKEATARSSSDQQLRAQPGSRPLLLNIIHHPSSASSSSSIIHHHHHPSSIITLQSSQNLPHSSFKPLQISNLKKIHKFYISIYIVFFALSKLS